MLLLLVRLWRPTKEAFTEHDFIWKSLFLPEQEEQNAPQGLDVLIRLAWIRQADKMRYGRRLKFKEWA